MVKVRLCTILAFSMLVFASFAPAAFAQVNIGDDDDKDGRAVTVVDCSQVQNAFAGQYAASQGQYAADDGDVAGVAQELNISQNQVNSCLGGGTGDNKPGKNEEDGGDDDEKPPEGEDEVIKGTVAADELPNTGGPSLLALGLGFALVAGGISLVRPRR